MLIQFFLIVLGIALLVIGGDTLIRGATALARQLGVSPLVIGLTVVAFGTSAPELSVNVLAAVQGNPAISFGNIIGSNIANIGLILGISAIVRPLTIQGTIIRREIPTMLLASLVALLTALDTLFRGTVSAFDRGDGLLFLLLFGIFLYYTIGDVIRKRQEDALLQQVKTVADKKSFNRAINNLMLIFAGLVLLVLGGKFTVDAAVGLAESLNISREIIGLTIIAVGTSLPELATSVTATWRGQTDIALGNVIGSNIFNLLLVNGVCSFIRPIPVPHGGIIDLLVMVGLSLVVVPLCLTNRNRIVGAEGVLLLVLFLGYVSWRVTTA